MFSEDFGVRGHINTNPKLGFEIVATLASLKKIWLPKAVVINRMSSLWMIWLINNEIILFVWMTLFCWPLNNALFCCVGSKSGKKIRKKPQAKKADIYTRMKNNICLLSTSTAVADNLAVEEYTVGDTVEKCQNNIKRVITVINETKKKLIEYHCMLGRELMQYKLISFSKYCEKCTVTASPPMSRHLCVVERPKTLCGCRFARQSRTKSGSRPLGIRP